MALNLTLFNNGYGEEVGWRGHAWPELRRGNTFARAALLLAIPWTIWHLPLFWIDSGFRGTSPLILPGLFVGLAAGAVVLGWLYEQSNASVLVVALFHTTLNMASASEGAEGVATAVSMAVILAAVWILRSGIHNERVPTASRDPE